MDKMVSLQKKLKADVSTRGASTADMVSRIVGKQEAIRVVLGEDRDTSHLVPSQQDVNVLESIDEVTKPLRDITDLLSGEKRVTCSAAKPLLKHHQYYNVGFQAADTTMTKQIKNTIATDFFNRYSPQSDMDILLDKCSFVGPQFKQLHDIDDETAKQVISEMASMNTSESNSESDSKLPAPPAKGKSSKIFGTSTLLPSSTSTTMSSSERVTKEIETYMQYPTLRVPTED